MVPPAGVTHCIKRCIVNQSFSLLLTSVRCQYKPVFKKFSRSIQNGTKNNASTVRSLQKGQSLQEKENNTQPNDRIMTKVLDDYFTEHEANGLSMQGTLRILLLLHATQDDTESVLSLLNKAKTDGVKPSGATMADITMAYIRNKNVDAAVNIYTSMQVEHPSYTLDSYKVVDLCTLLIENGRKNEAVATLEEYLHLNVEKTNDLKQIKENCRTLLMAAATTCDYRLSKQLFEMLLSGGLVKPDNYIVVPLLQCKLNSGDLPGAVEVVKIIYKNYKLLPKRMEILLLLLHYYKKLNEKITLPSSLCSGIGPSDTAGGLLEQMFNLIVQHYGSLQAQHDLLFACLEAGFPSEARYVLCNLGEEVDVHQVTKMCKLYSKMEREDALLNFLSASKGNSAVNRLQIFNSLLDLYNIQNEGEKGLSLWIMMQEETVSPSESFLSSLAKLLTTNNMKIPFQVQ